MGISRSHTWEYVNRGESRWLWAACGIRVLWKGRVRMTCSRVLCLVMLLSAVCSLTGCYELNFRQLDEKNVRAQFHVPGKVRLISLESHPKQAGFFGREGLRISAVFQFDDEPFKHYTGKLEDRTVWKPVRFVSYSPDLAEEYSEASLRWSDLPVPPCTETPIRHWKHAGDLRKIGRWKFYCSLITAERGERIEHPGGGYHYRWKYLGRSWSEVSDPLETGIITTFGVLDYEKKRLYAHIRFSG